MNPTDTGAPEFAQVIATFILRFNRKEHRLGELHNRWRTVERDRNIVIKMKVVKDEDGFLYVVSMIYFHKKRPNGRNGIPKFYAQMIGVYTDSMHDYDAVQYSRAGFARVAYLRQNDGIYLRTLQRRS